MPPELGKTAHDAILNLSDALRGAMVAALVAAIVIVCVVEILKIPARALFHWLTFRKWVTTRLRIYKDTSSFRDWIGPIPDLSKVTDYAESLAPRHFSSFFFSFWPYFPRIRHSPLTFSLPGNLFLKQVENLSRKALDGPGAPRFFFAAGASIDFEPPRTGMTESTDPRAVVQALFADQAERNLDDLQLPIAFWWPTVVRLAASLLGVGFMAWASNTFVGREKLSIAIVIIVGLVAGYVASVINDSVGILRGWRRSSQS